MKPLPRIAAAVIAAGALVPELPRYVAEHRLHAARLMVVSAVGSGGAGSEPVPPAASLAASAAGALPGDSRALIVAGSAYLVARRPGPALGFYRGALTRGERPEILLNMGRAYMLLGRRDLAQAALLRAGWVSPLMLAALPDVASRPLAAEIERLEHELRAERLVTAPPLPRE